MTERGDANGLTGNRARDHLANERTYMAWLRTTLGIAATGALFARLADTSTTKELAAAVACGVVAVAVLGYGTKRYYDVARDLEQGQFRVAGRAPLVITLAVALLIAVLLPMFAF